MRDQCGDVYAVARRDSLNVLVEKRPKMRGGLDGADPRSRCFVGKIERLGFIPVDRNQKNTTEHVSMLRGKLRKPCGLRGGIFEVDAVRVDDVDVQFTLLLPHKQEVWI